MDKLIIDLDVLQDTYNCVNTAYWDFQDAFDKLEKAIDKMEISAWKSPASEEFFKKYSDQWKKDIELFMGILEQLNGEIGYAWTEYSKVNSMDAFPSIIT